MATTIPPLVATVGPIADQLDAIVGRVAENLHVISETPDEPDPWVVSAVDAAVQYVIEWAGRQTVGLPADALTINGVIGFATRIHQDAFTSASNVTVSIGDPTFEPIFQPEHLFNHWRHYFRRLYMSWGVA